MNQIRIKPNTDAAGAPLKVRLPERPAEFLPADGAAVEETPYWIRRLNDGSVVRVESKTKSAKE